MLKEMPALLILGLQVSMLPSGTYSPWMAGSVTPHVHKEPYLMAGDADVSVIWYHTPLPPVLQATAVTLTDPAHGPRPPSDRIVGYFAMNAKPVNFPIQAEPYHLGMDTHVCHASLAQLRELHANWEELARRAKSYLETRGSVRPISRSPSQQRKAERSVPPPEELVRDIGKAVRELASFFNAKPKEVGLLCQRNGLSIEANTPIFSDQRTK